MLVRVGLDVLSDPIARNLHPPLESEDDRLGEASARVPAEFDPPKESAALPVRVESPPGTSI